MSIDIFFSKNINVKDVLNETSLTIIEKFDSYFLCDGCGNVVQLYSYKETDENFDSFCIRNTNPYKILDELVEKFNTPFIDDDILQGINLERNSDEWDKIYLDFMNKHGYLFVNGKYVVIDREEGFYDNPNGCKPCNENNEEEELPF